MWDRLFQAQVTIIQYKIQVKGDTRTIDIYVELDMIKEATNPKWLDQALATIPYLQQYQICQATLEKNDFTDW